MLTAAVLSHRFSLLVTSSLALAFLALAAPNVSRAQSTGTPVVANPISDVVVAAGTKKSKVDVSKTFTVTGANAGQTVKFSTVLGDIEVALTPDVAPATVANFLGYVTRGDYANTFFSRSVPGFVIQGGGYKVTDGDVDYVEAQAAVTNEFNVSNTRGTIAMAKLGSDPNSATDEWFFNLVDNGSNLDNNNGGFTVFGRVTSDAGLAVMDAVAALQIVNAGSPFDTLPVLPSYVAGATVSTNDVALIKSIALEDPVSGTVTIEVIKNKNPALVTAIAKGSKLVLKYAAGQTGKTKLTLQATSTTGATVTTKLKVIVQ